MTGNRASEPSDAAPNEAGLVPAPSQTRTGEEAPLSNYLRTINDDPDELHGDITPSVRAIGQIGLRAVPSLLDLMTDGDEKTRLHAQRALEMVLERQRGFVTGQACSPVMDQAIREQWHANGNYSYSADTESRAASVMKWRRWLTQTQGEETDRA